MNSDSPTPIPIATLRKKFADLESELRMAPRWSAHVYEFARVQPAARAHFEKRGLSPEDIEALPVTQLGMMYYMSRFDSQSIEVERALNLPYWQALPLLKKMEERFAADSIEFPDIPPFHRSFSYRTFFQSQASSRRGFAMLRHVEALRLYAADHGGRLPDSLDELRDLPLPVDPFTGRSFAYRLENGTAILESLVPAFVALRYEIKIRGSNP